MNNKKLNDIKWGDIYYCDLGNMKGSVQCGKRPVIVIQSNRLNRNSPTVMVAVITSVKKKKLMSSHIIIGKECGLQEESMIMLEQTRTIDKKEELLEYIGAVIDKDKRNEIKRGIKSTYGIPVKTNTHRNAMIINLCPHCREKIMSSNEYILRRIDPLQSEKEQCDKCGIDFGYEYMVMKRNNGKRRND